MSFSLEPLEATTEKTPEGAENDPDANENRRWSSAKDGNKTDRSRANSGEIPGESSQKAEEQTSNQAEEENENENEMGMEDEGEEENMYSLEEEEDETGAEEQEFTQNNKEDGGLAFLKDMTFDWQKEGENQNLSSITGNDAEIQKLFGISTAIQDIENLLKGNYDGEEEEGIPRNNSEPASGPGPDPEVPQYPRKKVKEWLVHCDKEKTPGKKPVPKYTVLLSPQASVDDVVTAKENYIPIKCNVSDPNHLETWGSIKALRGSTAQTTVLSGAPSRFTLHSAYCSRYNARCRQSVSSFLSGSASMKFDPKDEPIWQRGRHFTHPSDPNKRHFITIINTLNYDIKVMESTQSTLLQQVLDSYRNYNANIDNYRWTDVYEKPLDFSLTLHQNGLVDNSYITDEIGLDYYPVILLFFNDGFENDPPMQLDIRKAFVRDEVLLCRNYRLHGVPDPREKEAKEEEEQQQEPEEKVTMISPLLRSRKSTISSNEVSKGGDKSQRSSGVKYSDGSADSSEEARKRLLSAQKKTSIKLRLPSFEDGDDDAAADIARIQRALSRASRNSGGSKKSNGSRKTSFAIKEEGSEEGRKTLEQELDGDDDVEQTDGSSSKKMSATEDKDGTDIALDIDIDIDVDINTDADAEIEQLSNMEKRLSTNSNGSGKKKNSTDDSDSIPPELEPAEKTENEESSPETQNTERKSSRKTSRKKMSNVSNTS